MLAIPKVFSLHDKMGTVKGIYMEKRGRVYEKECKRIQKKKKKKKSTWYQYMQS
jgi:hypothetical protein